MFPITWLNRRAWVEFFRYPALLLPVMQSGVDSEASTCSTDSVSEEDSLKAGPREGPLCGSGCMALGGSLDLVCKAIGTAVPGAISAEIRPGLPLGRVPPEEFPFIKLPAYQNHPFFAVLLSGPTV